jgi:hypothetical protein
MAIEGTILVSPVLTDFAINYTNQAYIGTKALPIVPRSTIQGTFYKYPRENSTRIDETARGVADYAGHTDWTLDTDTYNCYPAQAWRDFMPDLMYAGADIVPSTLMSRAQYSVNKIMLSQEKRISDLLLTAGTYPSSNRMTLSSTGASDGWQFDKYVDGAGSVFSVIEKAKSNCYRPMDAEPVLLLGGDVYRILKHHPDLTSKITGGATKENAAIVMLQTMAELFEVSEVLVGDAEYNSTPNKATATYAKIWGNFALVFYRQKTPSIDSASLGYTFVFSPPQNELSQAQYEGIKSGWRVKKYHDKALGGGGTWVEAEMFPDEKIVASDCGCLISAAIGSTIPS